MILEFCNIRLRRLNQVDLEMVRKWRNDKKIAQHMFFQEEISSEMQENWFASLNPDTDYYFIIESKEAPIGLCHISQIDETKKIGQVGLFIYEDSFWGTHLPIMASIALLKFSFEELMLSSVEAKVRLENVAAKDYNIFLGFKQISNTKFELNKENFEKYTRVLEAKLNSLA